MSWIWSTGPEEDESGATTDGYSTSAFDTTFDTSPSATTSTETPDAFGTAFLEDVDLSPPETGSSPTSGDSFLSNDASSTTNFATLPSMSGAMTPTIDFSSMHRIDPSVLASRPSFQQGPGVDYVFADDYKEVRKKSPGEQLTFFTGTAFLTGSLTGASLGLAQAIPESAGKPMRLRLNAALNAVAKRGSSLGNTCSVLALAFSLSETALYNYTRDETLTNYAAAGALAGGFYKSTRGARVAGIWGLGGACLSLATVYATRQGYYGRGLQGTL